MYIKKWSIGIIIWGILQGFTYAQHPSLVLLHGALFTSSIWLPVQSYLQTQGYNVITIDTPGRLNDGVLPNKATLDAAVAKVCKVIKLQHKPVIVVGHNQAGAIMTQSIAKCSSNIQSLVYLAAVLPLSGEKPFDLLTAEENARFDLAAPLNAECDLSIPNYSAPISELYMADVNDNKTTQYILHSMVPEPIIFAYNELHYDPQQLEHIAKYYIKTLQDLIITPETQDKYITRQSFKQVFTLDTSHSPFISQPTKLAQILIHIADLET